MLEDLNILIAEKYLDAYSQATADGDLSDLSTYYSAATVIDYLMAVDTTSTQDDGATPVLEVLSGSTSGEYYVLVSKLQSQITKYGKGENSVASNDIFYLEPIEDDAGNVKNYTLMYRNSDGDDETIGDLDIDR